MQSMMFRTRRHCVALPIVIIESLRPIRERYVALMADPSALDHILADSAERARAVADLKIQDVKRKVGFIVAPNSA